MFVKKMLRFDVACAILSVVLSMIGGMTAIRSTNNDRGALSSRRLLVGGAVIHQKSLSDKQRPLFSEEYEQLSRKEQQAIEENNRSTSQPSINLPKGIAATTVSTATSTSPTTNTSTSNSVTPNHETDSNSQLVFVNLTRVIIETNKTDTPRVVSSKPTLIKQDAQIACGETNRNGIPSGSPSSESLQNRIVGGTKAEPGEFPYQVRLNIRSRRGSSLCGGVIIDQRHILTAAHCMTTWLVLESIIKESLSTKMMRSHHKIVK